MTISQAVYEAQIERIAALEAERDRLRKALLAYILADWHSPHTYPPAEPIGLGETSWKRARRLATEAGVTIEDVRAEIKAKQDSGEWTKDIRTSGHEEPSPPLPVGKRPL